MKRLFYALFMMVLGLSQVGCPSQAPRGESVRSHKGRQGRGDNETAGDFQSSRLWPGQIYSAGEFQTATRGFVSRWTDPRGACPDGVGTVSGQFNDSTGVRFKGMVEFTEAFTGNNQGSCSTSPYEDSHLEIIIRDSCAEEGANAIVSPEPMRVASESVHRWCGNQVSLTFVDSLGYITLEGSYNDQLFTGRVIFNNFQYWDGESPGESWEWGDFAIPTCDLFRCN